MVSAVSEDRAVRTNEVQDSETDFGQHCTIALLDLDTVLGVTEMYNSQ
jgi:hypothetical protein